MNTLTSDVVEGLSKLRILAKSKRGLGGMFIPDALVEYLETILLENAQKRFNLRIE